MISRTAVIRGQTFEMPNTAGPKVRTVETEKNILFKEAKSQKPQTHPGFRTLLISGGSSEQKTESIVFSTI